MDNVKITELALRVFDAAGTYDAYNLMDDGYYGDFYSNARGIDTAIKALKNNPLEVVSYLLGIIENI